MKKTLVALFCFFSAALMATSAFASKIELYAIDGRTMMVDESQVAVYTAEGMGWFTEKPVVMVAADGRTIVVPTDRVEAQKAVGWSVKEGAEVPTTTVPSPEVSEKPQEDAPVTPETLTVVRFKDGTIIRVPLAHVATYETLGWEHIYVEFTPNGNVIIYNLEGDPKEVTFESAEKYTKEGWVFIKPGTQPAPLPVLPEPPVEKMTIYHHSGVTKEINSNELEAHKKTGYGLTLDEAIYSYAVNGDGGANIGALSLLQSNRYELAFREVKTALDKIEANNTEYVQKLYSVRSNIIDKWSAAANSPLGFINYWFDTRDGKKIIVFEYRNISNKRITYLGIDFDVCDKDGKVIVSNAGTYYVNNIQLLPCEHKRLSWVIKSGDTATQITNLKVKEVRFADGTVWKAAE